MALTVLFSGSGGKFFLTCSLTVYRNIGMIGILFRNHLSSVADVWRQHHGREGGNASQRFMFRPAEGSYSGYLHAEWPMESKCSGLQRWSGLKFCTYLMMCEFNLTRGISERNYKYVIAVKTWASIGYNEKITTLNSLNYIEQYFDSYSAATLHIKMSVYFARKWAYAHKITLSIEWRWPWS